MHIIIFFQSIRHINMIKVILFDYYRIITKIISNNPKGSFKLKNVYYLMKKSLSVESYFILLI